MVILTEAIKPHFIGVDWVFHLAALADIVPSIQRPLDYHRSNVDGKYALLKVYRHAIDDYSWEIPRGFVEPGEDSLESVSRELEEETGLHCTKNNILSLGYVTPDAGTLAARIHLFVASQCQRLGPYVAREMGHCELKLFDFIEIKNMAKTSVIQDPCTLIAFYRESLIHRV